MAQITLPKGIASISGKIGNIVFRSIGGVQYAKRNHYAHLSDAEFRQECTATLNHLSPSNWAE